MLTGFFKSLNCYLFHVRESEGEYINPPPLYLMENQVNNVCLECGVSIQNQRWKQKYCSAKCGYEFNREET